MAGQGQDNIRRDYEKHRAGVVFLEVIVVTVEQWESGEVAVPDDEYVSIMRYSAMDTVRALNNFPLEVGTDEVEFVGSGDILMVCKDL